MTWQPIDTCPKGEDDEFLAYDPVSDKFDVCYWLDMTYGGVCSTQSCGEYGPMEDEFNADRATHWQALPAKP